MLVLETICKFATGSHLATAYLTARSPTVVRYMSVLSGQVG